MNENAVNCRENILELKKLDKRYPKGPHAVKELDYSIGKGSISAFLGPNGAGKSTTISMICGLCRPDSGGVFFQGHLVNNAPLDFRRSIGVVSQHHNLELDLTVWENLKVHGLLYGMALRDMKERIPRLLKSAALESKSHSVIRQLSGGQKRKVQLIRALLHDPELIILDEPTVGLDPASRAEIWDQILKLRRQGKTILFSTHYMEEAQNNADRVSIIHQGRIIADGTSGELIEKIGTWCRIEYINGEKKVRFYSNKQEAGMSSGSECEQLLIRKTSLEDVFIELTGGNLDTGAIG